MVGGEAGQGVQSVGYLLAKTFTRGGYYIFADQDYESRIRGGHNFYRIRIKDSEVGSISERINVLIALNRESVDLHESEVNDDGIIIYNSDNLNECKTDKKCLAVPMDKIAAEKFGNTIFANTIAYGAALALVEYGLELVAEILHEFFKSAEIAQDNIDAAGAGYSYVQQNLKSGITSRLKPSRNQNHMLINGNEAIALGAIASDCKFVSAYPMTPATSIVEYMASKEDDLGIAVIQSEDEISAVNMIVGASFAGARSLTATSGSGFCLMVEGLGLAGVTETPAVIVIAQRPGPAVGLPTRTEQGDLLFAIHAHHGDFPRAVMAPADIEEAFWLTVKAFNIADRYQIPVIILTDHHLATSYGVVDKFDLSKIMIDRGQRFSVEKEGTAVPYKRHKVTETGISPRAFPGNPDALVVTDSDEHDETGHMIEDGSIRIEQMDKRLRKYTGLKKETALPRLYGPKDADSTLIGWGSTYGALREAVAIMLEDGASVNMMHFSELWPFPAESIIRAIDFTPNTFVVENNASGQLAHLIKAETGKTIDDRILKYNGRPFTPEQIIAEMKGV